MHATATAGPDAELASLTDALRDTLAGALAATRGPHRIDLLCGPKHVADDPTKLRVDDADGRPVAVVLVAAQSAPDLVARGMRRATAARAWLGEPLGDAILTPLAEGHVGARSYTVLPYRRPFDSGRLALRYYRRLLRRPVFDWLADVNHATRRDVLPETVGPLFSEPLEFLAEHQDVDGEVRSAAAAALADLSAGVFTPYTVLMHGDLWVGNLLHASAAPRLLPPSDRIPFAVIDWPGGRLEGHPLYDLVRLADSMRLGRRGLGEQLRRHAAILRCDERGARAHLLAALGHLGQNLGAFPIERFAILARRCLTDMGDAHES